MPCISSSLGFKKIRHQDLTTVVLLLTVLCLIRELPNGVDECVTPKKRQRDKGTWRGCHQLSPPAHSRICQPGLLPRADMHPHSCALTAPHPGPQLVRLGVGSGCRPGQGPLSENLELRGPRSDRDRHRRALRLGLYLGDVSGLRLCLLHRAARRASRPREKNEEQTTEKQRPRGEQEYPLEF